MDVVSNCKCICGEAPIWNKNDNKVYWVDTENPYCYRMDLSTKFVERIVVIDSIQAMGRRFSGGWIAQSATNLLLLDDELQLEKDLGRLLPLDSRCVLNDSIVGPDGRYYIGYYDPVINTNKVGGLIRVDHDYTVEIILEGYAVPNGIAFSLDAKKMYLTEMFASRILEFDFDIESGTVNNKKIFATIKENSIYPDGLIIDRDGYLWSGQWQGFRIIRYNPAGNIDKVVDVPVPTPTCLAALPNNLIFITTAQKGCSVEQLEQFDLSGNCFIHNIEINPDEVSVFISN